MAYRWKPAGAEVDPDDPRAWSTCDRCGFVWNLYKLQWQYAYQGTSMPQNTRFLVCGSCLDPLNAQDAAYILSPDPVPIMNARPEPYALDETSWLGTEDGDILGTEDDDELITPEPNPADNAAAARLAASILASGGSVATVYLDLFDGDPLTTGTSVLANITGSATRSNIAASLGTVSGIARNPATITVAAASASTVNVSYVGVYDAATGGTLQMSGAVSVVGPSVTEGNPVVFAALALTINLN